MRKPPAATLRSRMVDWLRQRAEPTGIETDT